MIFYEISRDQNHIIHQKHYYMDGKHYSFLMTLMSNNLHLVKQKYVESTTSVLDIL